MNAIAYALAAIGLNVHFGYTGLLNFGQAGFVLLGAYAVAMPVGQLRLEPVRDDPVLDRGRRSCSRCCSASRRCGCAPTTSRSSPSPSPRSCASLVSTPRFTWLFGGTDGINSFTGDIRSSNPIPEQRFHLWKQPFTDYDLWVIIIGWVAGRRLRGASSASLMRSPWGRVLKSIREDEDAARSLGKNVFAYKMNSLVLGGVIGAFGGAILAIGNQTANPITYRTELTFFAYAIVVLGGVGKVKGPIIGAMIFWFIISFTEAC